LGDARCFGRSLGRFAIAPAAFSFLVNVGWKKSGLPQLANRFVGGSGFDQPGRFLPARIERYVSETRHDDVDLTDDDHNYFSKRCRHRSSKSQAPITKETSSSNIQKRFARIPLMIGD
jgi:hypothetical protein